MLKTEAYQEITTGFCRLADNLRAVQTLLNYLATSTALTTKQCQMLSPNLNRLELAHYHGLTKSHEVNQLYLIVYNEIVFVFLLL